MSGRSLGACVAQSAGTHTHTHTATVQCSITAAVTCTVHCLPGCKVKTMHGQYRCGVGKVLPAGFVCCRERPWRRTLLSFKSVFQLSVANRALDVGHSQCPSALLVSTISRYTHTPAMAMEELIDDFFNPARTQTQLQPDCSLDLNDEAITAHCSLLFAHAHRCKR